MLLLAAGLIAVLAGVPILGGFAGVGVRMAQWVEGNVVCAWHQVAGRGGPQG